MNHKKPKQDSVKSGSNKIVPSYGFKLQKFLERSFWGQKLTMGILLFVLILGLGVFLRCLYLSSDPPSTLSWSQDLSTDPPHYTTYARNKVLWGSWDLYGNVRYVFFLKSATSLLSFFFYKFLGVGRWQANLVSVSLGILTLIFLYMSLARLKNKLVGLLGTFFLAVNYIFLMYNRSPFMENAMVFFIVLGFYFLTFPTRKPLFWFLSGASLGISIFFGKMIALFLVPIFLGLVLLELWRDRSQKKLKKNLFPSLSFLAGVLGVSLFWLFFSYLPATRQVAGYMSEITTGLYGKPQGLSSVSGFLSSLFSFGGVTGVFYDTPVGTNFFFRMPALFVLASFFMLFYFVFNFKWNDLSDPTKNLPQFEFFFVFWLIVGVLALMPWNYRPLRYQVSLIPPLCVLAAFGLVRFLDPQTKKGNKINKWFWIFFVPLASWMIFNLLSFLLKIEGSTANSNKVLALSFVISIVSAFVYYLIVGKRKGIFLGAISRLVLATLIVLISLFVDLRQYMSWAGCPQYSLLHSSQDLGEILSPGAVISGPYASPLMLENKFKHVLHLFFEVETEKDLFLKFPITHLALEQGENRDNAFKNFPQVVKEAKIVTTYWLRDIPVDIYRIAEWTGNPEAGKYRLSDFEKAKLLIDEGQIDSGMVGLNQFVSQHPQNLSGYITLAEIYYNRKDFEKSVLFLDKALKFDPTNSITHEILGAAYLNLYNQKGNDTYRLLAIEEYEKALKLFPQNASLSDQLKNIRGY
jgi:4-amino-4-deoxy-L-arabinose transferase-like glycosyltransferase